MADVLFKAAAFIGIIAMGYCLRERGFFKFEDFFLISKIVVKITLPAAIVYNFSQMDIEPSLLVLCGIGFGCNVLMVAVGYLINLKKSGDKKAFDMINLSGYNIGNFTLPFVQSFLGPAGFAATSLFDTGNAVMCTGITYSLASAVTGREGGFSVKSMMKSLLSSPPFVAYIIMTILALCHIELPQAVLLFAETAGKANAFLALLMVGIGFQVVFDKENTAEIVKVIAIRYGTALLFALGFFFLTPFSLEIRQALAIISFGPVSSVSPAYTGKTGGDVGLSSAINSVSVVASIIAITITLIVIL